MIQRCPPCESTHDPSCHAIHIRRKGTQLDRLRVGNEAWIAVLPLERDLRILVRVHEDFKRAYSSGRTACLTGLIQ